MKRLKWEKPWAVFEEMPPVAGRRGTFLVKMSEWNRRDAADAALAILQERWKDTGRKFVVEHIDNANIVDLPNSVRFPPYGDVEDAHGPVGHDYQRHKE